jgi:hypothetical protein
MVVYCIDTSALIAAWQERYPIENFPPFWDRLDGLIGAGRLTAPVEVLRETGRRSDELHSWLNARKEMFRELEDAIQVEAANVLALSPAGRRAAIAHLCRSFRDCARSGHARANCHGRKTVRQFAAAEYS